MGEGCARDEKIGRSDLNGTFLQRFQESDTARTLSSPIPWLQALIFLSINVSFASLPVFLPTIIHSMDFSALTSQILSAPPYLASFVFVLFIGAYSDRTSNSRGWCLMACAGMSCVAYFAIATLGFLSARGMVPNGLSVAIRYAAIYPAAMGLFASVILIITWNLNNQRSSHEKGLAMMVMNVVGQCGPLVGVNLFPDSAGPHYVSGMIVNGVFMAGVVVLAGVLRWYLRVKNRVGAGEGGYEMVGISEGERRSAGRAGGEMEEAEGLMGGGGGAPGDKRKVAAFRYML